MPEINIKCFEPLKIEFPSEPIIGDIDLILPKLKIKIKDLSMGGIISGYHIGCEAQVAKLTISEAKEELTKSQCIEMIEAILPNLKEIHSVYQDEFNKKFLLEK